MTFRFIPLRYNLRNLGRRPLRTLLTILGLALVVFGCILMHSFATGLNKRQIRSASKQNVIILSSKIDDDITMSSISKGSVDTLSASFSGIKEEYGQRLISPEVYHGAKVRLAENADHFNLAVMRGVKSMAYRVHPQVNIIEGHEAKRGHQIMVGKLVAAQMGLENDALKVGRKLFVADHSWEIVGIFEAPGTVYESEIWCDADDLIVATKRNDYSAISLVVDSAEAVDDINYFCEKRIDLEVKSLTETSFYSKLAKTMNSLGLIVYFMLALVVFGGVLGGTNTMYAAVLGRFREFGTLRTLGFSKMGIFVGLCIESVIIASAGGVLGATLATLANDFALRIPMGAFALHVGMAEMLAGFGLALFIGFIGAIVPGIKSMKMSTVESIRAV